MLNLPAADTRVFLFHSPNAAANPSGAMDAVNLWLSKDRSGARYPNLRIANISVTADGSGGVYTLVVCDLGEAALGSASASPSEG
ncbi:MAG: hypothetical protein IT337_06580 [Thermomicrobiales bacterium]|nr:hypothetical protein [Thermomicrobiales bacterium]